MWNDAANTQPQKSGEYLVVVGRASIEIAMYDHAANKWERINSPSSGLPLGVTHWMELPSLPP